MTVLEFSVQFHQPFLIRSGDARGGLDAVARHGTPLPASSLKGAMRAACLNVLGAPRGLVQDIFGQEGRIGGSLGRGAWAWTDAGPSTAFLTWSRARNRIDPEFGVVRPEALTFSEEFWQVDKATFVVEQVMPLEPDVAKRQTTLLAGCAWGVTGLGSWRNRSMGSVTIRPTASIPQLADKLAKALAE